jgi:hypothetical protein
MDGIGTYNFIIGMCRAFRFQAEQEDSIQEIVHETRDSEHHS